MEYDMLLIIRYTRLMLKQAHQIQQYSEGVFLQGARRASTCKVRQDKEPYKVSTQSGTLIAVISTINNPLNLIHTAFRGLYHQILHYDERYHQYLGSQSHLCKHVGVGVLLQNTCKRRIVSPRWLSNRCRSLSLGLVEDLPPKRPALWSQGWWLKNHCRWQGGNTVWTKSRVITYIIIWRSWLECIINLIIGLDEVPHFCWICVIRLHLQILHSLPWISNINVVQRLTRIHS